MAKTMYPSADSTTQWAYPRYPGDKIAPNVVVLHTTETTGWPSYSTGYYPHLTYHFGGKPRWRQHLPLNRSARALRNEPGGVETNTLNCVQIELVGTCDPKYYERYGGLYWPKAPEDALLDVAQFLAWMHDEWGLKLQAPDKWPPYPKSYANGGGQRMSGSQWRNFYGVCGHMHVPENDHGDPGDIAIDKILAMARGGQPKRERKDDDMTVEELLSHKVKLSPNAAKLVTGKAESIERTVEQLLVWSYARATAAHLAVNVDRIGEAIANELLPKLPAGSAGGLTMQQVVSAVEAAIRKVLGSLDGEG